jgi:hypothetical protein
VNTHKYATQYICSKNLFLPVFSFSILLYKKYPKNLYLDGIKKKKKKKKPVAVSSPLHNLLQLPIKTLYKGQETKIVESTVSELVICTDNLKYSNTLISIYR